MFIFLLIIAHLMLIDEFYICFRKQVVHLIFAFHIHAYGSFKKNIHAYGKDKHILVRVELKGKREKPNFLFESDRKKKELNACTIMHIANRF